MKNLVSIIIPMYNSSEFLKETLNSIINQVFLNWECIIIDDGSTDNSVKIVEEYILLDSRFQLYKRPDEFSKGANSCRNFGLGKVKGSYIQFFDSDDLMLKNHLEDKLNIFFKESKLDVIINRLSFYENGIITHMSNIESNSIFVDSCLDKIDFYVSGPLWKLDFLLKNKIMFDDQISNLDDWDFNLRALLCDSNFKLLNTSTILYRQWPNSLSKQISLCNPKEIKSEIYARFKVLNLYEKNKIETKEIKIFIQKRIINLYLICLTNRNFNLALFCLKSLKDFKLNLFVKSKLVLAFLSFKFFNKGYQLLK
ncbi:glycosyltransferase family 2 protein [Polaribacter sp. 11A2H]|uniref:glycosyltransferase family 2 protein n=1 Tax=Polaribacter sp. 11A2H TaxID=2687290 RepID=UPI00140A4F78|nr:glycosyltransferase family 2 protein [Polaribacter sp. 11A2H]